MTSLLYILTREVTTLDISLTLSERNEVVQAPYSTFSRGKDHHYEDKFYDDLTQRKEREERGKETVWIRTELICR